MNSLFYQSLGCYQEFTLHCRNLNVGWFSPYLPIFRVVEWTYISLKISRFRKKISRAPFQLGSSGEAGVVGGREERGASIVHPQYLHPPPNRLLPQIQNGFTTKCHKAPVYYILPGKEIEDPLLSEKYSWEGPQSPQPSHRNTAKCFPKERTNSGLKGTKK